MHGCGCVPRNRMRFQCTKLYKYSEHVMRKLTDRGSDVMWTHPVIPIYKSFQGHDDRGEGWRVPGNINSRFHPTHPIFSFSISLRQSPCTLHFRPAVLL